MIPKIIHYCWFGRKPKPESVLRYMATWRKYLPDYEIKEWNEDNFDVNMMPYTKEAYYAKKYAFVSDVARLYALYKEGGVYLDTDVEVRKSFNAFLQHKTFLGWEADYLGTGMIACEKGQAWTSNMLESYSKESFISFTGKMNIKPNPYRLCEILSHYGLVMNRRKAILKDDINIYPIEYFCAHLADHTKYCINDKTVCIHYYDGSWTGTDISTVQKIISRLKLAILKFQLKLQD